KAFDKLHVLLRHRLLLQPHGLEGGGWIGVADDASHHAVLDRPDPCGGCLHLATAAMRGLAKNRHHPLAAVVDRALDLRAKRVPRREPVEPELPKALHTE